MARTPSTRSPNRPMRTGRDDHHRVTGRPGQQPSTTWMLSLLNATTLR